MMNRACDRQPNSSTSNGSANLVPSTGDSLPSSATRITRALAWATIFSRSSAPPPPLMTSSAGSISSAPSIVRSSRTGRSSFIIGIPSATASSCTALEVAIAVMPVSSPRLIRVAISRVAKIAVEPVPSPMVMPDRTKPTAASAAMRFSAWASVKWGLVKCPTSGVSRRRYRPANGARRWPARSPAMAAPPGRAVPPAPAPPLPTCWRRRPGTARSGRR